MSKPKVDKIVSKSAKKQEIPEDVLWEILTPSEIQMLKNRWQIINLLEEGLSVRAIASKVKVGTDTVMRTARMLERSNLRKVIDQQKDKTPTFKTSTPWIFGKGK